jgi:uncharacterized membrane protein YphA (DoxX/SURF4 family)
VSATDQGRGVRDLSWSVRLIELTDAGARFGPVGYELPLLYLVALVSLAANEPGPCSVDRWRRARTHARDLG